jgi:hypothetical protein
MSRFSASPGGTRKRFRGLRITMTLASAIFLAGIGTWAAALSAGDHTNPKMVDTNTPEYLGWDPHAGGYHYRVTGSWRAVCGSSNFCWPAPNDGETHQIGSNDFAYILFSQPVIFKKFHIQNFDACLDQTYDQTTTVTSGQSDSFTEAFASVNDAESPGYTIVRDQNGNVLSSSGPCKLASEPTSGASAVGGGGGASVTWWWNLQGAYYQYDVWVNPKPATQGACYTGLAVKGGYEHTWTSDAPSWSVGLGFPWGFSFGVADDITNQHFRVGQGNDGYDDPNLNSPKVCQGGP